MFTLYMRWDAERELTPDDIQFIQSPRDALNMASIFYELDYLEYDQRNRILPHRIPKRREGVYHRFAAQAYKRKHLTEYDGLYDEVKWNLDHGWMVAAASLLVIRNPAAAQELTSYLGKYKKAHVLLDNVKVSELSYLRRDRVEYNALRKEFNTVRPKFLKSISSHPDALTTFDTNDLFRLENGGVPSGWEVHHKIPLDDGGTNTLDNLVLIKRSPYHSTLSKAQGIIIKEVPHNAGTNVLWPSPNGVIYPVGK